MSFLKYVKSLRQIAKNGQCTRFVLGNSGADYDSVVGALVYAFYMTNFLKTIHLPIIDCSQQDIPLRFQIDYILQQYEITKEDLLYTEMFPQLYNKQIMQNNTFLLYDHNFRPEINKPQIVQIIDHHAIEEKIQCPNIIEHCGSALTLLYYLYNQKNLEKFKGSDLMKKFEEFKHHQKAQKKSTWQYDPVVDELIYYGILLDSFQFDISQKGRWNQYDTDATQQILQKVKPKLSISQIEKVKTSAEYALKLTLEQHLRKDFKDLPYNQYRIKYSTILLDADLFISHYWKDVEQKIPVDKIQENKVVAFMFAYSSQDGILKRQMIFAANQDNKFIKTIEKLLQKLKMVRLDNLGAWRRWEDPTSKISRKLFDKQLRQCL